MAGVSFLSRVTDFSLLHGVQSRHRVNVSFYPVGARGSFPGVAGAFFS
jgi:hypothetical protein